MLAALNASLSTFNALSAVVAAFHVYQIREGKKKRKRATGEEITNGLSVSEMNYKSSMCDSSDERTDGWTDGGIERQDLNRARSDGCDCLTTLPATNHDKMSRQPFGSASLTE